MIKSINLKNFQSHKDSKINFSPGVNVIVGPSRNGKTVILRALRWVVDNRPAGADFRSHWTAPTDVTVVKLILKDDQHLEVWKEKNKTINRYLLGDGVGFDQFEGFGQDVPQPVSKALNLSDLNFQYQFDSPFLLFDSPGAVARYLNQIVHLEKIDIALANIASEKRQNDQETRSSENRIEDLNNLLATFPDLEAAEEFISDLENIQAKAREAEQRRGWLVAIQTDLASLRAGLVAVQIPTTVEHELEEAIRKNTNLSQIQYTAEVLRQIQTQLIQAKANRTKLNLILKWEDRVAELSSSFRVLENSMKTLGRLSAYKQNLKAKRESLSEVTAIIEKKEKEFKERMPAICPLCGK